MGGSRSGWVQIWVGCAAVGSKPGMRRGSGAVVWAARNGSEVRRVSARTSNSAVELNMAACTPSTTPIGPKARGFLSHRSKARPDSSTSYTRVETWSPTSDVLNQS